MYLTRSALVRAVMSSVMGRFSHASTYVRMACGYAFSSDAEGDS